MTDLANTVTPLTSSFYRWNFYSCFKEIFIFTLTVAGLPCNNFPGFFPEEENTLKKIVGKKSFLNLYVLHVRRT